MNIEEIKQNFEEELKNIKDLGSLNDLKVKYLSKKGLVQELMMKMKDLSKEEKPLYGQKVNQIKAEITGLLEQGETRLKEAVKNAKINNDRIDITLDAYQPKIGNLHPLDIVQSELEDIFIGMGYTVAEGPEVETEFYNFERANTPEGHPARDMQDTLYIKPGLLLRTQTTAIQTRVLEASEQLPIRIVCPGKVYRKDDDDATHSHQFMQMEGICVGKDVTLADLKFTLQALADAMFGAGRKIRFRPSYFPFTEPSFEVDVSCHMCDGVGCPVCKGTGYIEVLGAGMIHPNVLRDAGFDPNTCSGFAFGVGLERVAMLKFGIDDIRNFYINDLRFNHYFDRFE
ncbi:MAG: phenylalanine--tRNA ligase subunit alpha [Erysipelotrichaceae bacterium]|nr:phenylalanine--tRNA ligase subunit alpha [Erysipelotrichaceae bacterium]